MGEQGLQKMEPAWKGTCTCTCCSPALMPPKPSPEESFIVIISHGQKGQGETNSNPLANHPASFHKLARTSRLWLGITALKKVIVSTYKDIESITNATVDSIKALQIERKSIPPMVIQIPLVLDCINCSRRGLCSCKHQLLV